MHVTSSSFGARITRLEAALRLLVPGWLLPMVTLALTCSAPVALHASSGIQLFNHTNLVAWCIVPFDSKKRGPEERAAMLEKLGIRQLAYDYRAEHVPTFDAEIEALSRHGIRLTAWWFPTEYNDEAKLILQVLKRHGLRTQLWVMGGGGPVKTPEEQRTRVEAEVRRLRPIAEAAAAQGCQVALYNHGAWFGEPENQLEIIQALGATNVGIVYNLHHGHEHLARFPALLQRMKPHLMALNLNGMVADGEQSGRKILPLGLGDLDAQLLRIIRDSGWDGPIGILNHTDEDAEARLLDNLEGLDWLLAGLQGNTPGPRPRVRSWREPSNPPAAPAVPTAQPSGVPSLAPSFGKAVRGGMLVPGKPEYRTLPITIECWARLESARGFNILVASDTKASADHWELYSYAGSGEFSVYQPGRGGEYKSGVNIADGTWHHVAAILEANRVRLCVDARVVLDKPSPAREGSPIPDALAFGRLVEGGIGCEGSVDEVRLSRGAKPPSAIPTGPGTADNDTLGLWHFDDLAASPAPAASQPTGKYWAVEDAKQREQLPLYKTLPAAASHELTPANGLPAKAGYEGWERSHGTSGSTRYSSLNGIHRGNVASLKQAWVYRSKDKTGNIQCNPIEVRGVLYAPTPGDAVVAFDGRSGEELWRFVPGAKPAFRGLVYWRGTTNAPERLFFTAGKYLHALSPDKGRPVSSFGDGGRVTLPGNAPAPFGAATAAPAVCDGIIILPGFEKDVWGFDAATGRHLWSFHTVPQAGEFGADTWDAPESYSANCWGGMCLDETRAIAYFTTGSPKPNFVGVNHRGDNLFANCVLALDARTGKRLWHFQEIQHDIWDLDIGAPPLLTTVTHEGRRVDVVAATTKIGNTLLLDRVSGKPLFPFRLRRASVSDLPGEQTAPYQPDVELPEPFARQEFLESDITDRSDEAQENIAARFKSATTGWFRPFTEGKMNLFYGLHGGAEWTGACADPFTGRLYVSGNHIAWIIALFRDDEPPYNPNERKTPGQILFETNCASCHGLDRIGVGTCPPLRGLRHRRTEQEVVEQVTKGKNSMPAAPPLTEVEMRALLDYLFLRDRPMQAEAPGERPRYTQNGYPKFLDHEGYPGNKPPWGTLNCIDLNTGKIAWRVPLGVYPELLAEGKPPTGTENFGGPIVTAGGLVFCSGTRDGKIRAFDADSGKELWSADLPWVGTAPPMTYAIDGRQYVVVPSTGGGKLGTPTGDAYVAFALPPTGQPGR